MKLITEAMVEKHLSIHAAINAVRRAMIAVSRGEVTLPIRQFMPVHNTDGKMAVMPGALSDPDCFGVKLVSKYPREADSRYGSHVGMVLVFDSREGAPLAMIEGASLTAIRTSAASALATDLLANKECGTLAILGYGEQAKRHIRSMLAVRTPENIVVWGRREAKAKEFAARMTKELDRPIAVAASAQSAVQGADLICTTTSSAEPVLMGAWLKDGAHVNLVGAAVPTSAEADSAAVARSRYVVDYRPAAMAAAGELLRAIEEGVVTNDPISAEIGEIIQNPALGRKNPDEITVYKSLGVAAQDLAAGHLLYEMALSEGFGTDIEMMDYSENSLN